MFRYVLILDRHRLIYVRAFDPFRRHRARRDRTSASERLEARVHDVALVVHLNLQLHHVPARGSPDDARADVQIALIERTNISWVFVMIHHLRCARRTPRLVSFLAFSSSRVDDDDSTARFRRAHLFVVGAFENSRARDGFRARRPSARRSFDRTS